MRITRTCPSSDAAFECAKEPRVPQANEIAPAQLTKSESPCPELNAQNRDSLVTNRLA